MKTIEFHFDFGSPNAYLSHLVLPGLAQRTGARVEYVPVLLGGVFRLTNNRSPMESLAGIRNKMEYAQMEMRRFIARHGITTYHHNPFFPVNTLMIMRGAVAAKRLGVFETYVDAVYRAMWCDQKNMGDASVVGDVLAAAGLDAARLLEMANDPEVKAELMANTQQSVDRGNFGSPSFFIGDEMWFGKDKLAEVEDAVRAGT